MNAYKKITAAILVGGLGTRLQSVVRDRPKDMALVSGRPFLTYLLDHIQQAGIRHVVLCTGHMANSIEHALGSTWNGWKLTYSCESEPRGTGGALRLAYDALQGSTALIMNGDSYCQVDMHAFIANHQRMNACASLLLAKVDDTSRYGRVQTDHTGRVLRFAEKAACRGPGWINAGMYLMQREVIGRIVADKEVSLEREVFGGLVHHGLFGYRGGQKFLDIGTPQSYVAAEQFFGREIAV